MSQCPVCSTEIQDSFGLVECPNCKKILFADFDGTLKVQDESAQQSQNEEEVPTYELEESDSHPPGFNTQWNLVGENPPPLDELDPVIEVGEPVQEAQEAQFSDVVEEEPEEESSTKPMPEKLGMIEDINQFANSDASMLKKGQFIYNLTISNIDTEELKYEILEVLKENKLNIDTKKLKFALPTLELKDLNPVKVSVIVSKIKHLPVDVEWVQKSAIMDGGE